MTGSSLHSLTADQRRHLQKALETLRQKLQKSPREMTEEGRRTLKEIEVLIADFNNPKPLPELLVHVNENGLEGIYATDPALIDLKVTTIDYDTEGAGRDDYIYVIQSENTLYQAKFSKTHIERQTVELVPFGEIDDEADQNEL